MWSRAKYLPVCVLRIMDCAEFDHDVDEDLIQRSRLFGYLEHFVSYDVAGSTASLHVDDNRDSPDVHLSSNSQGESILNQLSHDTVCSSFIKL